MRVTYEADLRTAAGSVWLPDYACDLELSLDWDNGEPCLSVDDVLVDVSGYREPSNYISMLGGEADPLMAQVGQAIQKQAEEDDALLARVLAEEGIYWIGGANNPDGRWRVAS